MTFCVAMKVHDGLVAIADTRITTGAEHITARKVSIHEHNRHSFFLMTSGLRAARDKALTYFEEVIEDSGEAFNKLHHAANAFGEQVRRVVREDRDALQDAGLTFNLHTIIGGQLERDGEHRLYLIYPQGNWVEVARGTPYYAIGESSYGKPLIDRTLTYDTALAKALKIGYLAFDATRASAVDVDFPIDVVLYRRGTYRMIEHRYERDDLLAVSRWWQDRIRRSVDDLPEDWLAAALDKVP